jgi:hypothetical protein
MLQFHSTIGDVTKLPKSISNQLTHLELDKCHFEVNVSTPIRHFSALNVLKIHNARIDGSIHRYFILPVLRELHLDDIIFVDTEEGYDNLISLPFSDTFFPSIPQLASLHLIRLELGEELTDSLQECPLLQELVIDKCITDDFMASFIDYLTNYDDSFPALRKFHFRQTWPLNADMTYEDLIEWRATEKPHLNILNENSQSGQIGPWLSTSLLKDEVEDEDEEEDSGENAYNDYYDYYDEEDDDRYDWYTDPYNIRGQFGLWY